jgi:hypothetical protein
VARRAKPLVSLSEKKTMATTAALRMLDPLPRRQPRNHLMKELARISRMEIMRVPGARGDPVKMSPVG